MFLDLINKSLWIKKKINSTSFGIEIQCNSFPTYNLEVYAIKKIFLANQTIL